MLAVGDCLQGIAEGPVSKRKRNRETLELEPPWAEYRKQEQLQQAVDPVRLKAERDRCSQLLDGSISWTELLGER